MKKDEVTALPKLKSEYIRYLYKTKGIKFPRLAELVNIHTATLSSIVNNSPDKLAELKLDTVERIHKDLAEHLGVEFSEITEDEDLKRSE